MTSSQSICAVCRRALRLQGQLQATASRSIQRDIRRSLSSHPPRDRIPRASQALRTSSRPSWPSNHKRISETPSQPSRLLSTHPRLSKVLQNPRYDEDGNEMLLQITPRASNRLKQISTKESAPQVLRITVESGGCHGFQYLMSLSSPEKIDAADDTVIEAEDGTGSRIVLDEPSLELLNGSKVDYTMELIGSQFKIVDNPAASSSCGCGTSFDVKALG